MATSPAVMAPSRSHRRSPGALGAHWRCRVSQGSNHLQSAAAFAGRLPRDQRQSQGLAIGRRWTAGGGGYLPAGRLIRRIGVSGCAAAVRPGGRHGRHAADVLELGRNRGGHRQAAPPGHGAAADSGAAHRRPQPPRGEPSRWTTSRGGWRARCSALPNAWEPRDQDGTVSMPPFTHELLAQYVGTSREIVTHYMSQFRREGLLRYSRAAIAIHRAALIVWLNESR
jgi:hypothetical protein